MKKHKRYPNQIKDDKRKEYDEMETSHADMTDFRRPAYSVRHPDTRYTDTQNVSTGQQNEAEYLKSEYGTHKPSDAALIRAQGEQIREGVNRKHSAWIEDAEKYIAGKYNIRGDADGHNKGTAPGVPE